MTIEIANRLCAYRKKHGLSQEELAEKIGVSRQAVSKWERAEASPDTDNLILLAQVYGVTLDELLNRDPDVPKEEPMSPQTDTISFKNGIHVNSQSGDKVHIDLSGVHVDSADGDSVHIALSGIRLEENGHIGIDSEDGEPIKKNAVCSRILSSGSWSLLCCIAYFLFGCFDVCGGWAFGWLVFLTIPLYSSVWEAIHQRDITRFCYPVFITLIYLILGFAFNWWHPAWILFLTIPVFYSVFNSLNRKN